MRKSFRRQTDLLHAPVQNKPEMQKSRRVNGGADGQQEAGNEAEAGPLEDEHRGEGGGRQSGVDVASAEEDGRRGEAEQQHRLVRQVLVFQDSP